MHPFLFHIISILVRIYMLMLHAFTARRSVYEPRDTVQNGRFTVTHTHAHSAERRFDDFKSSSTQACLLRENVLST